VTLSLPQQFVTGQYGDVFTFLSGRLGLDLTTTLQVRHHPRPIETLSGPAEVSQWMAQAGLAEQVDVDAAGLERTRNLREAIYRLCRAALTQDTPDVRDIEVVNRRAAEPPLIPFLVDGKVQYRGSLDQALSTIARDAIELLGGPRATRIRECAHPDCSRLFLDSSHAVRRRWCGMTGCGNKSKSATYRERRRDPHHQDERATS
jgi:predicted RNA-binding Zn ribbon-like protein